MLSCALFHAIMPAVTDDDMVHDIDPMIFPVSTSFFVISISSLLDDGSPDGWLRTTMMCAAYL